MLELRNCPVCDTIKEVCRVVHIRKDDKLYACPTCGVLFASPQYEPSELKHIYNKEFYNDDVTLHKGTTALGGAPDPTATETIRKALIKRYPALAAPGIKILDYGCGLGQFLATFKKYGADCLGIELSGVAAASARQRFGLNVIEGDEETLEELPDGEFQLISMLAVLEHVRSCKRLIGLVFRKLAPNGVLCVSVPNSASLEYKIKGERWWNVATETHLTVHCMKSLQVLLPQYGFRNLRRLVFWGGRGGDNFAWRCFQFAARMLGVQNELIVTAER